MKGIKRIISAVTSAVMAFSIVTLPQQMNTNAVFMSYENMNINIYHPSYDYGLPRIMSDEEITLYKNTHQEEKIKINIDGIDVRNVIDENIYKDLGLDGLPIGMYQDSVGPVIELWNKNYTEDEINGMWPQYQKYAREAKSSSEVDFPSTYKTKITGDVARSMQKVANEIYYNERMTNAEYERTDYIPQNGEKYDLMDGDFPLIQVEKPYDIPWRDDYPGRYLKLKEDGTLEFYKNPSSDTMASTMWIRDLKTNNIIAVHVIIHSYAAHYGCDAYINDTIDTFVAKNFKPGMTEFEKMDAVMKWFANDFEYHNGAASEYDVWLTGKGDCWAFPEALSRVCDRIGIKCRTKTAYKERGCSATHEHSIVELDGELYIADRGYEGHTYSLKKIEDHYKNGAGDNAYDGNWKIIETDDRQNVWGGLVADNGIIITRYFGFDSDVVVPETMTINGRKKPVLVISQNTFHDRDYDKTHQEIINSVIIPNNVGVPLMAFNEANRNIYAVWYDGTPIKCISAGTGTTNANGEHIPSQVIYSGWGNKTGLSKDTALWWHKYYEYDFPVPVDVNEVLERYNNSTITKPTTTTTTTTTTSTTTTTTTPARDDLIVGDLTGDKCVDVFDMVLMRQALVYGYDDSDKNYVTKLDVNKDGAVTVADAVTLQKYLLGAGTIK